MTLDTRDFQLAAMHVGMPALVIGFHDVARSTKLRLAGFVVSDGEPDRRNNDQDERRDPDSLKPAKGKSAPCGRSRRRRCLPAAGIWSLGKFFISHGDAISRE